MEDEDIMGVIQDEDINIHREEKLTRPFVDMIPCKVGFFSFFGASTSYRLFWPLYLKQRGFNAGQVGAMSLSRPLGGVVGSVVCGLVMNKYISSYTSSNLSFLFLFVFICSLGCAPCYSALRHCPDDITDDVTPTAANYSDNSSLADDYLASLLSRPSYLLESNLTQITLFNLPERSWLYDTSTMWILVIFVVLIFMAEFFYSCCRIILITATIQKLGPDGYDDFGKERAWGAFGAGCVSLVAGAIIGDFYAKDIVCRNVLVTTDYTVSFYIFGMIALVSCFNAPYLFTKVNPTVENSDKKLAMSYQELKPFIMNTNACSWLCVYTCRCMLYAVSDTYLFWHLEDIGASSFLLGLSGGIKTFTEFLVFLVSSWVLRTFGHPQIVIVGIVSYILRFIAFAVISNPWFVIPLEILEGAVFACFWSTFLSEVSGFVPENGQPALQGLTNALNLAGQGIGFVLGGTIIQGIGAPGMFLVFSAVSMLALCLFMGLQAVYACRKH